MNNFSGFSKWVEYQSSRERNVTLLVLSFLFIGAVLRFYKIDSQSLWFDELHSIVPTNPQNSFLSVVEYSKSDQPPLYFILLYGWYQVFPYNEVSGKILSVIIGMLGIVAMYFTGKEVNGTKTGLAVSFLTACNYFHLYYSQELRFYGLLFLVSAVSFCTFLKFVKKPSLTNHLLFVLASIATLYTHYYGIVVALSEGLIYFIIAIVYKKQISFYVNGILCAIVVLFAFSPWLEILLKDNQISDFWITDPGPLFFFRYFMWYFAGFFLLRWIVYAVILYYIWLVFSGYKTQKNDSINISHITILGWTFFTFLIPYLYTIFKMPMIVDRYTIITLPALLLMVAMGWVHIKNLYIRLSLVVAFVVFTFPAYRYYFYTFKKQQFRELSMQIIKENDNSYPVISEWAWHFNYFFKKYSAPHEVLNTNSIGYSNWTTEKFWIIIPELLDESQRVAIEQKFEVEKEIKLYNANATLYKRRHSE